MNPTQQLITALLTRDDALLEDVLKRTPEAAVGRGDSGESALQVAAYMGRGELGREWTRLRPADLHEAVVLGLDERVAELLAADPAMIGTFSYDGWTPLHLAGYFGQVVIARQLVTAGAKVETVSRNAIANQPLHATLAGSGSREVMELLLAAGADVNGRGEDGITPLHLAGSRGLVPIVEWLLELGADPAARMKGDKSAAQLAEEYGHAAAAERLRRAEVEA